MDEKEFKFKLAALKVRSVLAAAASLKLGERTKELLFSYDEPLAKGDLAQLKVVQSALKVTLDDVQNDLNDLDALAGEVAELSKAGATFIDNFDDVKSLTADVSEARRKATTRTLPIKAVLKTIEAGVAKLGDGKAELLDAWAKIDQLARTRDSGVDEEKARLGALKARALAAKANHAAAELKTLQGEAGGVGATFEALFTKSLGASMADFSKRLAHNPQLAQAPEMVRQKAETQKLIASIAERTQANAKLRNEIGALKADPVDLAKAAKELGGIASNLLPKLEKALAADPTGMLKALEGVLKEAGRSMTGKDAITKLKKARVI